jgi:hypothetical protein
MYVFRHLQRQLAEPAFGWGGRCRYHADSWWYEISDLARKLILTGVMVFVARDSSVQIAVGCLVNFAVLLGNVAMRPCADSVVRPLPRWMHATLDQSRREPALESSSRVCPTRTPKW